jgi:hypothetical protein
MSRSLVGLCSVVTIATGAALWQVIEIMTYFHRMMPKASAPMSVSTRRSRYP